MIKLPDISGYKDEYYSAVKKLFLDAINEMKRLSDTGDNKYDNFLTYIYDSSGEIDNLKLKTIICGDKNELDKIIDILEKKIPAEAPDGTEINYDLFDTIYTNFAKTNFGRMWAHKIGLKTCPYCNRSFTFTLKYKKVRPEYDHFYPKSIYPYLCVSMYNLIPCCRICNQAKSSRNTHSDHIIYPYEEEFGKEVIFDLKPQKGIVELFEGEYEVDFTIKSADSSFIDKAKNSIDVFHLKELYNLHKNHIDKIMKLRRIYCDEYINSLFSTFGSMFRGASDFKDTLFVSSLSKDKWGDTVLAKLTSDVIDFIDGVDK